MLSRPRAARSLDGPRLFQKAFVAGFALVSAACFIFGSAPAGQAPADTRPAQGLGEQSGSDQLQALQRERDELKKRNAELEARLKTLQATVDTIVRQALGQAVPPPIPMPPPEAPAGTAPRRRIPFVGRFPPMFPPFPGTIDPVEMAIAFSDAVSEKETARSAADAAKSKKSSENSGNAADTETPSARLAKANRKVELLRQIITTAREVAAGDVERLRKLNAAHAVTLAEIQSAEARLRIIDQILATDPEAPKPPTQPTVPAPATTSR
jgi:hypothetical protein